MARSPPRPAGTRRGASSTPPAGRGASPSASVPRNGASRPCPFRPKGRIFAAGGGPDRPTVRVGDFPSGRQVRKSVGHTGWLKSVAFSADSKRLVSASRDTTAMVWDVARAGEAIASVHELDSAAMSGLWSGLADDDAAKAYQAIGQLSTGGDAAV